MVRITLADPAVYMQRISALMLDNWEETGFDFEFAPSVEMYQQAVAKGVMFALAAVDGDDVIGYCTMAVTPHMHNPSVIVAANDALFVRKDRRGIVSARLIVAAEDEAKRRGASRVLWHTRAGTGLAHMLERRGYTPSDVVVMKEI
jgi:GNAT superfamily N-acetyltransferase